MKNILSLCASVVLFTFLFSCKDVPDLRGRTPILNDSIRTTNMFPTFRALHIDLNEDWTEITVVIGDPNFYGASAEEKNKKAEELGKMIVRIYGTENYLDKGTLVVTKDVNNTSNTPADGISVPIDLKALKKAVSPN
ncbi:MAG: hypothetical protein K0Q79_1808 [Flavipsychrobacter sp.]|nr:hypothetical protein [Flavipsychrobacter sp.]